MSDQALLSLEILKSFNLREPEVVLSDASRSLARENVSKLLDRDYQDVEHGYVLNEDSTWYVACHTVLPEGCTGQMLDFWFCHCDNTERYKWWHPVDHIKGTWSKEYLAVARHERKEGHYIGNRHKVTENIGGETTHLEIEWVTPHVFGFGGEDEAACQEILRKSGVTGCFCGIVHVYDFPFGYLRVGYLVHMVTLDSNTGLSTLKSRFWLGHVEWDGSNNNPVGVLINRVGNTGWFRRMKLPEERASGLLKHCSEEMYVLGTFLPAFYLKEQGRGK